MGHLRSRSPTVLWVVLGAQLAVGQSVLAASLKEMYDLALPGPGHDKEIVLETGVVYTGGLWVGKTFNRIDAKFEGPEEDVRIVGNGAILDLQGGEITIGYSNNRLDIEDCVIVNGSVRFRGYEDSLTHLVPEGSVRYVTFYKPHDYGVRMVACGAGILIERNIVVDAVDTGWDFLPLTGEFSDWLPTGVNISISNNAGGYDIYNNWSFHSDPVVNADLVNHLSIVCDYG
jgi:hypothetical protein